MSNLFMFISPLGRPILKDLCFTSVNYLVFLYFCFFFISPKVPEPANKRLRTVGGIV